MKIDKEVIKDIIIEMLKSGEISIYIDGDSDGKYVNLSIYFARGGSVIHTETSRAYM